MKKRDVKVAIIGGGASGLICALKLSDAGLKNIKIFERNDRLGKKLSSTGNGQGNITNLNMGIEHYCSSGLQKAKIVLEEFDEKSLISYFTELGGCFVSDDRGRVYPSSYQAASVTDLLRFAVQDKNICFCCNEYIKDVSISKDQFRICSEKSEYFFDYVVVCTGGQASKHFGTDGNGYEIAKKFGHSITRLRPTLVQLRAEKQKIKGLKGVKCNCKVKLQSQANRLFCGDLLFTDYGVSGDVVFKLSTYAKENDVAIIDFLPQILQNDLQNILICKMNKYPEMAAENYLRCIINSALARLILNIMKINPAAPCKTITDVQGLVRNIKEFRLGLEGGLGFDTAQVTQGGILMSEVDEYLMSNFRKNLFFAGEILDVDGECGGYNLQWAFSSGARCAQGIIRQVEL